jgi:hypothetical protein
MARTLNTYGQISPQQQLHFLKKLFNKIKTENQLAGPELIDLTQIEDELNQYNQATFEKQHLEELIITVKSIIAKIEVIIKTLYYLNILKNMAFIAFYIIKR